MIAFSRAETLATTFGTAIETATRAGARSQDGRVAAQGLLREVQQALVDGSGTPAEVRMRGSLFVHGERTMASASISGRAGITFLRVAGIGGVAFDRTASLESITRLLEIAASTMLPGGGGPSESVERALVSVPGLSPTAAEDDVRWTVLTEESTRQAYSAAGLTPESAESAKLDVVTAIERAVELATAENVVDLDAAREASEQILSAAVDGFADVLHVAERPEFDVFTVQHSLRVSLLTSYVASTMGVDRGTLIELTAAAMFHDVGKGRVPQEVLYKPGRLDDDELRVMQQHPWLGAEILIDSDNVSPYALGAAWGHHVRFDGKGYPGTRPWFRPTRATSLIQVCDVFEALTSRRPYKPPYSPARAYQILYSDPGAFDPAMLAAFTRAMGLYPPGRFVALSDGCLGRVAAAGAALDRPVVRLFPNGEVVDLGEPRWRHLRVMELVDELDVVARLRGDMPDEEEARAAEADADPRDEEFHELAVAGGHDHGHDGQCRLC